uniref:Abnormal cell migration protein 18-like fibronectin type I domain-containing protein n=1 Tax=Acrobeloides nanus TaxID=290746 RepID=A0A914EQ49_9BILA
MGRLLGVIIIVSFAGTLAEINAAQQNQGQCWTGGNGKAPQWWDQGARIDRGKYWYECRNGELKPMGCFTEKGDRIPILGTYNSNGYVIECAVDERGYLNFKFIGCTDGTRNYQPGETWEDKEGMYWFECKQDGPYVRIQVGGCIAHDKSKRLAIGERYDFGEYTYECQRKFNGSVQMCSVGCVHNGAHYKVGEQWP